MLIIDDANKGRLENGLLREAHRQEIADTVALKTAAEVKDWDNSPTNPMRQWGRAMLTADFEKKLAPILPSFIKCFDDPRGEGLRHMYVVAPDLMEHLLAYPNPHMPEHSICYEYTEDVPDMSVTHIDRKDVPDAKWISPSEGFQFDTSDAPLAGMKRVRMMGGVALKGWRQVLLQLIGYGAITVADAERIFGADNRKEWGHKSGKIHAPTIW
jgi:hypothetical protein